jgi:hypothetical protein
LDPPPEGSLFTQMDIENCIPIIYSYRNIAKRVADTLRESREFVKNEELVLERVRMRIEENSCPICLDRLKTEPAAIMLCCNAIMHVSCVVKCRTNKCPLCRVDYGRTFLDTFVCLHHDTDTQALIDATSTIVDIAEEKNKTDVVTKITILRDIIQCNFSNIKRKKVELNKLKSVIFDEKSEMKSVIDNNKMKVLIYCSSNKTLRTVEKQLAGIVEYSRLTQSSTCTYKKICNFKNATRSTAILANSWGDAAGIDFKMATDVIILNYIESAAVLHQMIGRVLRIGQQHRPRIHLISYNNEAQKWMTNYVKSTPSSN